MPSMLFVLVVDFNTSHVTVYPDGTGRKRSFQNHFNTSHVTVYRGQMPGRHCRFLFQYIPCYGLSKLFVAVKVWYPNFNTSHVTVYPNTSPECPKLIAFQYIPCYGLSKLRESREYQEKSFQYIPCYGLSKIQVIRTMTVMNFNTSHVTVYPRAANVLRRYTPISIHPMLRFI